ncbi:TspO/MBR family protein [Brevibacillus daliensis]|uniref:TspO/MBR family protein n=1 Tax=Brevibacillus daliensis TaxID=2892995 RepID=UPI001E4961BD|nr:tryptophan-rich sensory protein [Brevibacillus daliensis]
MNKKPSILSSIFVFVVVFALFLISGFLFPNDQIWYNMLEKPSWTPPDFVIGIVWFILYALIALAVVILQRSVGLEILNHSWYLLFVINYFVNQAFSFFLFHQKDLYLAFEDSFSIAITTLLLLLYTSKYSLKASLLLVPYLLWAIFATYLSWTVYQMNL